MATTRHEVEKMPAYRQVPSSEQLAEWTNDFERDGFCVIPNVLSPTEVVELREGVIHAFDGPDPSGYEGKIIRHQMFLKGSRFEDLIDRSPVIDAIEAILGPTCHMISMNAIVTRPGEGIIKWHADETVHYPRPEGVPLDPRVPMPTLIVQSMFYLVDVDEAIGPTQFVPRSQRSGRQPDPENLTYEGRGIHSVLVNAGDVALQNGQTWHRGAPNMSEDRTRVVQQVSYGRRWIAQRFYPFVNHHMPEDLLERSSERRRRLLGIHPRGAYG